MRWLLSEYALHHFLISLFYTAHISAEAVLVELFVSGAVPEAACVGRNFISENYFAVKSAEFNFKIYKVNINFLKSLTINAYLVMSAISSFVARPRPRA